MSILVLQKGYISLIHNKLKHFNYCHSELKKLKLTLIKSVVIAIDKRLTILFIVFNVSKIYIQYITYYIAY